MHCNKLLIYNSSSRMHNIILIQLGFFFIPLIPVILFNIKTDLISKLQYTKNSIYVYQILIHTNKLTR